MSPTVAMDVLEKGELSVAGRVERSSVLEEKTEMENEVSNVVGKAVSSLGERGEKSSALRGERQTDRKTVDCESEVR